MSQATRDARRAEVAQLQNGEGKFLLTNRSGSELHLPKPSLDPQPKYVVPVGGQFIGDTYHTRHLGGLVSVTQVIQNTGAPDPQQTRHEHYDPETQKITALDLGPDFSKEVTDDDLAERQAIERAAANLGQEVVCEPGQAPRMTYPPMERAEPVDLNPPPDDDGGEDAFDESPKVTAKRAEPVKKTKQVKETITEETEDEEDYLAEADEDEEDGDFEVDEDFEEDEDFEDDEDDERSDFLD